MLNDISLHILDLAQNSINADSHLIEINIEILKDIMHISIKDDGKGMSREHLLEASDPFFTTRKTRKVGLGIAFFKQASELSGGSFNISSKKNVGTEINATFELNHIDCLPIGNISSTIHLLIVSNDNIDFLYTYSFNNKSFKLDTREVRRLLEGIPLYSPEVSLFIKNYLNENKEEVDRGKFFSQ